MDRAEIAEDILAIGSTPGVRITWQRFIFTCVESYLARRLANGVTGNIYIHIEKAKCLTYLSEGHFLIIQLYYMSYQELLVLDMKVHFLFPINLV